MDLVRRLKAWVIGPNRLDPVEFRKSRPVRHPEARQELNADGGVKVYAPIAADRRRSVRWFNRTPSGERAFELEEIGAHVWSLCDGKTSVGAIAKRLQERYKMNKVEAETALGRYLETLAQRGLITLLTPKK